MAIYLDKNRLIFVALLAHWCELKIGVFEIPIFSLFGQDFLTKS